MCFDCAAIVGINPLERGLTLRRLYQMAQVRREYEGGLFAWQAAVIVARIPFTGEQLNPNALNPYRRRSPDAEKKLREVKQFIANIGLKVLSEESGRR